MIIEIQRQDLINLCKYFAQNSTSDLKTHKFKEAFEIRPYSNGPLYRFSEAWAIDKTDEQII
jgi:hypothetical protein